jgi:hypothetical protein
MDMEALAGAAVPFCAVALDIIDAAMGKIWKERMLLQAFDDLID